MPRLLVSLPSSAAVSLPASSLTSPSVRGLVSSTDPITSIPAPTPSLTGQDGLSQLLMIFGVVSSVLAVLFLGFGLGLLWVRKQRKRPRSGYRGVDQFGEHGYGSAQVNSSYLAGFKASKYVGSIDPQTASSSSFASYDKGWRSERGNFQDQKSPLWADAVAPEPSPLPQEKLVSLPGSPDPLRPPPLCRFSPCLPEIPNGFVPAAPTGNCTPSVTKMGNQCPSQTLSSQKQSASNSVHSTFRTEYPIAANQGGVAHRESSTLNARQGVSSQQSSVRGHTPGIPNVPTRRFETVSGKGVKHDLCASGVREGKQVPLFLRRGRSSPLVVPIPNLQSDVWQRKTPRSAKKMDSAFGFTPRKIHWNSQHKIIWTNAEVAKDIMSPSSSLRCRCGTSNTINGWGFDSPFESRGGKGNLRCQPGAKSMPCGSSKNWTVKDQPGLSNEGLTETFPLSGKIKDKHADGGAQDDINGDIDSSFRLPSGRFHPDPSPPLSGISPCPQCSDCSTFSDIVSEITPGIKNSRVYFFPEEILEDGKPDGAHHDRMRRGDSDRGIQVPTRALDAASIFAGASNGQAKLGHSRTSFRLSQINLYGYSCFSPTADGRLLSPRTPQRDTPIIGHSFPCSERCEIEIEPRGHPHLAFRRVKTNLGYDMF
jgi:hypothetical protein